MRHLYCLISSSGDLKALSPDCWPKGIGPRDRTWIISPDGRIFFCLDGLDGHLLDEFPIQETIGFGEDFDLSVVFDGNALEIERGHCGRIGLYLFRTSYFLLVTSDLKALLDSVECRLNVGSALHYLTFGIPFPGHSYIDGVRALPAGHKVVLEPGAVPRQYRTFEILSEDEPELPDGDGIARIAKAVDCAILERSGDDGIALLLSAGIDSSYIAMLLGERIRACYTSDFPDVGHAGEYDDARRLTQLTGQNHVKVPIQIEDARAALERVLKSETPKSAWSALVQDVICREVGAQGHRTLVSGLGADEVFGGYFHYADAFRRMSRKALAIDPEGARNPLELVLGSGAWRRNNLFTGIPRFFGDAALRQALVRPWAQWDPYQASANFYADALARKPGLHLFEAMIAHESQHRIPELLISGFEPFADAHSISTAYPFLDRDVMRMAAALGAALRFAPRPGEKSTENKILWRAIAAKRVPEFVMKRRPSAYDAPIRDWLADETFLATIIDAIRLGSLARLGLFNRQWLESFADRLLPLRDRDYLVDDPDLIPQAWALATFAAWQDRVLDVH